MSRRYYTSRNNPKSLTLEQLCWKLQHLFFRDKDYFKEKTGITNTDLPDSIKHKAALSLNFQPFPITEWNPDDISEDQIFDVVEFLYDHVSEPGEWVGMTTDSGYNYYDYEDYGNEAGQEEFRIQVNVFLSDYKNGMILALGSGSLMHIFDATVIAHVCGSTNSKTLFAVVRKFM